MQVMVLHPPSGSLSVGDGQNNGNALIIKPRLIPSSPENSSFVIWEMFSGNEEDQSQSGEEKDFYFSDDDN